MSEVSADQQRFQCDPCECPTMVMSDSGLAYLAALPYLAFWRAKSQSYPESVLPNGIAMVGSTINLQVPEPEPTTHSSSTLHATSPSVLIPFNHLLSLLRPKPSTSSAMAWASTNTEVAIARYMTHRILNG